MAVLMEISPGYLFSLRGGDLDRPACFPDLTPYDFILCGYLKAEVLYRRWTREELKATLREEIVAIRPYYKNNA